MDKEKEIEEIAKRLHGNACGGNCSNKSCCCKDYFTAQRLINWNYGNVKDYQAEIDRLQTELAHREEDLAHVDEKVFYRECEVALNEEKIKKQAVKEFAGKLKQRNYELNNNMFYADGRDDCWHRINDIVDELSKEYEHGG